MQYRRHGFTIIELLIVIVVIAILAAIIIVAYNGIQSRAQEAAMQADLKSVATKILQFQAENGAMPTFVQLTTGNVGISVSKSVYPTTTQSNGRNLGFCIVSASSNEKYAVFAQAKSKAWYSYSSTYGARRETATYDNNIAVDCATLGISSSEIGYYSMWGAENGQPNGWYSWIGG